MHTPTRSRDREFPTTIAKEYAWNGQVLKLSFILRSEVGVEYTPKHF